MRGGRVITRLPVPMPGAIIRAMPGELESLSVPVSATAVGADPAMLAAELLGRYWRSSP